MADFLAFLTDADRRRLIGKATRREYAPGETIVRQGDRRHAVYVLDEGEARVERSHGEFYVEVAQLGPGEVFGEMSFLEGFEASASVVADSACTVHVIDGKEVEEMIEADPGFYGRFYHSLALTLSQRLRETTVDGIAEFSWGGRPAEPAAAAQEAESPGWGGGSPIRDEL